MADEQGSSVTLAARVSLVRVSSVAASAALGFLAVGEGWRDLLATGTVLEL